MTRIGLAPFIGALSLVLACGDDGNAIDPSESSSGGEESTTGVSPTTTATTTLSTSADTTDGETTVVDPTETPTTESGSSEDSSSSQGSSETGPDLCGNDMIDGDEVCDGTDLGGADCVSRGFDGGTLGCNASCASFDETACTMEDCGNNTVEGREVCDGTDLGGEDCASQGYDAGTLGCSPSCMVYNFSGCSICGDNDQDGDELCDGNDVAGESCVTQGFQGGTLGCSADCSTLDLALCNDIPPCTELDIGSAVGTAVASGNLTGGDDDLGQSCSFGTGIDTVVQWVAPAAGTYRFDTVDSTVDTVLTIFDSCFGAELACNDQLGFNNDSRVVLDVAAGDLLLIAVSGYNGGVGPWELNINIDAPGGPCCTSHGSYGCDSEVGCEDTVCALDSSCCDPTQSWTLQCATLAASNCASCADVCGNYVTDGAEACDNFDLAGQSCNSLGFDFGTLTCANDCTFDTTACGDFTGDCCSAHVGQPGCDDDNCVAYICGNDSFCCNTNWDAMCAAAAATGCANCNPDVCGNNLIDVAGEVCDGVDLAGEDCSTQGFDAGTLGCADDCTGLDTSGCFDAGDCCSAQATADCNDAACSDAVCSADAFCCATAWDSACANEALGLCTVCDGGAGDCCNDTGDVGCNDALCVETICGFGGLDPTCCSVSWTAACTALAGANCANC